MIQTYSDYIKHFMTSTGLAQRSCPGEHHFVSAYFVPRLYEINSRIPDYINPDGTKGIIGDVVYYRDHEHQFGIEVKLGTIRLTKNEFNTWIVFEDHAEWPHIFLGIGTDGIGICPWEHFRMAYIRSVQAKDADWQTQAIESGYGPMKSVNTLLPYLDEQYVFSYCENAVEAANLESAFIAALRSEVNC